MRVSVIGGSSVTDAEYGRARELGAVLAERGHVVVCGGLGGVMEGVCRGAGEAGGKTVGILPGSDPAGANQYVDTAIATGMGRARNALVVLNGDAAVAVDGSTGTLSEIALALDHGRPVAGLVGLEVDGVAAVETPTAAVDHVETAFDGS
jgi:uncharacterized protein (TIGR00725 family)